MTKVEIAKITNKSSFSKFVSHVDRDYTKIVRQTFVSNKIRPQRSNGSNVVFFYFYDGLLDAFLEDVILVVGGGGVFVVFVVGVGIGLLV